MRTILIAACALAAFASAAAAQSDALTAPDNDASLQPRAVLIEMQQPIAGEGGGEAASPYEIIDHNVAIPFAARTITGYRIGLDRSLILDGLGSEFYRAELNESCARDLRWETRIGVQIPTVGSLRANDYVTIDGRRCRLMTLDQIADPRGVEQNAEAE